MPGDLHMFILSPAKHSQSGMWPLSSDLNHIYILSPLRNFPLNCQSVSQTHIRVRYVKRVTGPGCVLRLRMEQTRDNTDDSCEYVSWITNRRPHIEVRNIASGWGGVLYHLTIRKCELYESDECLIWTVLVLKWSKSHGCSEHIIVTSGSTNGKGWYLCRIKNCYFVKRDSELCR